ncbi:MAG: hypothetical protein SO401_04485 [Blautia sp.]|nr:hypothetical protein [Blautia sp.]
MKSDGLFPKRKNYFYLLYYKREEEDGKIRLKNACLVLLKEEEE